MPRRLPAVFGACATLSGVIGEMAILRLQWSIGTIGRKGNDTQTAVSGLFLIAARGCSSDLAAWYAWY